MGNYFKRWKRKKIAEKCDERNYRLDIICEEDYRNKRSDSFPSIHIIC